MMCMYGLLIDILRPHYSIVLDWIIVSDCGATGMTCLVNVGILAVIASVIAWMASPYIFVDVEIAPNSFIHLKYSPDMNPVYPPPETMLDASGNYQFGRYSDPIENPFLHELNIPQRIFQRKEWQFLAASDGRMIVGLAIANMGYIESGFLYIYEVESRFHDKVSVVLPGGMGAGVLAPSSVAGCSSFDSSKLEAVICFDKRIDGWNVTARGRSDEHHLQVDLTMLRAGTGGDEFSMVYPLGPHR